LSGLEQLKPPKSRPGTEIGSHDSKNGGFGTDFGSIETDFSAKAPPTVPLISKMITLKPIPMQMNRPRFRWNQK
jgi:hypothetical protein